MTLIINLLFLIAGLYFVITGHWFIALILFLIVISLEFFFLLVAFSVGVVLLMLLTGCANTENISINQFKETKNIYIDNTAVNNYVGNPCAFYVGSRCIFMKKSTPRNPDVN